MLVSELMQVYPLEFPLATSTTPGAVTSRKSTEETDLGVVTISKAALGSNPNGTLTKKFLTGEVDGRAFIYWYIRYKNAGALVTSFSVPFPATAPHPLIFDDWPVNSWVYPGSGGLLTDFNDLANGGGQAGIYKESNGSLSLKLTMGVTGIAAKLGVGFVSFASVPS